MADTYKIVRHYYPDNRGDSRRPRVIERGLTLEQAQGASRRRPTACCGRFIR